MDVGRHQIAHRGVHGAVASDGIEPGKGRADDVYAEVAAPVGGAGMPGMVMALVLDFEELRGQRSFQRAPDGGHTLVARQWANGHGSTLRKGRTSTR